MNRIFSKEMKFKMRVYWMIYVLVCILLITKVFCLPNDEDGFVIIHTADGKMSINGGNTAQTKLTIYGGDNENPPNEQDADTNLVLVATKNTGGTNVFVIKGDGETIINSADANTILRAQSSGSDKFLLKSDGDITSHGTYELTTTGSGVDAALYFSADSTQHIYKGGTAGDLNIEATNGKIILTTGHDVADTIYLHANAGVSETIKIHADQGTGAGSIELTSDAGGIDINAAADKDVDITGGQFKVKSTHNIASAISLTSDTGTDETIVITNTKGTGSGAITLTASAGDISLNSAASGKVIYIEGFTLDGTTLSSTSANTGITITGTGSGTVNVEGTVFDSGDVTIGASNGNQVLNIASHDLNDGGLKLAGTLVTASASEINKMDGVTASTTALNYNDITTLGSSQASKVVTADSSGTVKFSHATRYAYNDIGAQNNGVTVDATSDVAFLNDDTNQYSNSVRFRLPDAASWGGRKMCLRNKSSGQFVVSSHGGNVYRFDGTSVGGDGNYRFRYICVISDGSHWWSIGDSNQ